MRFGIEIYVKRAVTDAYVKIFVPLKYLHKKLSYLKVLAKDQTVNLFALRKGPSLSAQYDYPFAY